MTGNKELFNSKGGLSRVAGNTVAYYKLLISFARNYRSTLQNTVSLLKAGDRKGAEALIHKFKGVAGNIGADKLFSGLNILDDELKKIKPDTAFLKQYFAEVYALHKDTLTVMKDYAKVLKSNLPAEKEEHEECTPEDILKSVLDDINDFSANASENCKRLRYTTAYQSFPDDISAIETLLENYEYDEAKNRLVLLQKKILTGD